MVHPDCVCTRWLYIEAEGAPASLLFDAVSSASTRGAYLSATARHCQHTLRIVLKLAIPGSSLHRDV